MPLQETEYLLIELDTCDGVFRYLFDTYVLECKHKKASYIIQGQF